ncbi:MAG TPA: hypothetical protein VLM89_05760 [Phycisphaerae bacterium]|nr:hypothetical protein [Phycisphaerae bacterium]
MMVRSQWLPLLILAATCRPGLASQLDEPCPIELRNVPFRQAVEDLSARFNLPVLMDTSVTPDIARQPVRMFARHLTGRQALNWLARWAGLEAAFVDGSLLIAAGDRLPRVWRREIAPPTGSQPVSEPAWLSIRDRTADLEWVDVPLSLVAREVSARFGVDVIFDAAVLQGEALVNLRQTGITLGGACQSLADQLGAVIAFVDGALWVRPRADAGASQPTTRASTAPAPPPGLPPALATLETVLDREVVFDRPPPDWRSFAKAIAGSARVEYRLEVPPEAAPPDFVARGTAREILEAGKLLGRLDFQIEPSTGGNRPVLLIRAHRLGR